VAERHKWRALVVEANPYVFAARVLEQLPFTYLFGSVGETNGVLPVTISDPVRGSSVISVPMFRLGDLARLVSFDRIDVLSLDQVNTDSVLASADLDALGVQVLDLWEPSPSTLEKLSATFQVVERFSHSVILKRK
jgi:hypothetical protein